MHMGRFLEHHFENVPDFRTDERKKHTIECVVGIVNSYFILFMITTNEKQDKVICAFVRIKFNYIIKPSLSQLAVITHPVKYKNHIGFECDFFLIFVFLSCKQNRIGKSYIKSGSYFMLDLLLYLKMVSPIHSFY